jgi:hypothetical protein
MRASWSGPVARPSPAPTWQPIARRYRSDLRSPLATCRAVRGPTLLEAVFGLLGDEPSRMVGATIPLGDRDLLAGLTDRLTDVRIRAAGATCLIGARM